MMAVIEECSTFSQEQEEMERRGRGEEEKKNQCHRISTNQHQTRSQRKQLYEGKCDRHATLKATFDMYDILNRLIDNNHNYYDESTSMIIDMIPEMYDTTMMFSSTRKKSIMSPSYLLPLVEEDGILATGTSSPHKLCSSYNCQDESNLHVITKEEDDELLAQNTVKEKGRNKKRKRKMKRGE